MKSHLASREALISWAIPSDEAARQLAALTDDAVRELARAASSRTVGRFALVALGGWGSGALLPSSDLDLLVLSDASAVKLKPFVEAVLYPLWDAGLDVGHQVRSPQDLLRATRTDLATRTAALTGRVLAGDAKWAERALAGVASESAKHARAVLTETQNRERPGSPYLLEPDLKYGAGGRRDYDELTWSAAVLTGRVQHTPEALVTRNILTAEEFAALTLHAQTVSSARFELARMGAGNQLSLDAAESLVHTDPADVQLALAETALLLDVARRRMGSGTANSRGTRPAEGDSAASGFDPSQFMPMRPDEVFALLDQGEAALPDLERAAQTGRLEPVVPGFRELMTLRRSGLGHQLTVGAHSLRAAVLATHPPAENALCASLEILASPRTLQVATLAHDAGKAEPGLGHAERGAGPAYDAALRFGLTPDEADDVASLVRLHLLLPETATRADLDDEDTILSVAARIMHRGLIAPLHLLTAADSIATGPTTWTPWISTLVSTLVTRLDAALSDEVDGAGIVSRATSVREHALELTPTMLGGERAFIEAAPLRYLASRTAEEVVSHAHLVASLSASFDPNGTHISVAAGPAPETHEVTVVAADKPELLARIAGAMALAGLDILAVDAYGAMGGVALDTFVVASATRRAVSTDTFANLDRLLSAALRDRLELRTRLTERRRHYPASATGPITVKATSDGFDTAVQVVAPDRPGLLHDLAAAVSACDLNIRWAKVLTVDGMATDTFHVVDSTGGPVNDSGVIGHLVMRLREVR